MYGLDLDVTRTAVFHFMAIGQLLIVYAARHTHTHPLPNPYVHAAVGAGIVLQVAATNMPGGIALLGISALPLSAWAVVAGASVLTLGLAEVIARYSWRGAATATFEAER
jgi:Ca2+-transporting ATPase